MILNKDKKQRKILLYLLHKTWRYFRHSLTHHHRCEVPVLIFVLDQTYDTKIADKTAETNLINPVNNCSNLSGKVAVAPVLYSTMFGIN